MIIDTHTHIFDEETYKTYKDKSAGRINEAITLHFWVGLNDKEPAQKPLESILDFAKTKEDLSVVAALNMHYSISEQLEKFNKYFQEEQIVGVKLYPGYQRFYPSDERIFPIAALCQKYNKPLIFHSGDVFDEAGSAELKYSHPIHVDGLAVRYPECKIVIAHFGFPYHLETANIVSKNKNVFTEVSGTILEPRSEAEAIALLNQYIKDLERVFAYFPDIKEKVMFGTDYAGENIPLNQVEPYIKLVEALFSKEEQKNVFYELAKKLFFSR